MKSLFADKGMLIAGVVCLAFIVYAVAHPDKPQIVRPAQSSSAQPESSDQDRPYNNSFHGYDCTVDCSGHKAGYEWAEQHMIDDGEDCDRAGEHSNSPSFAEGCHAYVDGDTAPDDDDDDNSSE